MKHEYKILYVPPSGTTAYCQHAWIAYVDDTCVGHIHMEVEANQRIKFLDAWVHENHRKQGIFRKLWDTRWDFIHKDEEYGGFIVYAWCKPMSLPLLLDNGFVEGDTCVYVEKEIRKLSSNELCFVSC